MPYDDPSLSELRGYFKAKEPGKRARAEAWATAIGLQKVDGLTVSRYLVETAKAHIEGRITQAQAKRRIHDYYEAKDERYKPDPEQREPDKVSERIAARLPPNFEKDGKNAGGQKKVVRKGCQKMVERLLEIVRRLRRVGPDKGGHWEVGG